MRISFISVAVVTIVLTVVLGLLAQAGMNSLRESTGSNPSLNGTSRTTVVDAP